MNTISQYNVPIKKYTRSFLNRMAENGSIWYATRDGRKQNGEERDILRNDPRSKDNKYLYHRVCRKNPLQLANCVTHLSHKREHVMPAKKLAVSHV